MDLDPEFVVTVSERRTNATTDHHPLRDGYVNDRGDFTAAVETARKRYTQSGTVLVHCAAGISRSTTVIATTLAVEEECSFDEAVAKVAAHRERARPHEKLRINALNYLATRHDRQEARDTLVDLVRRARLEDATQARALDGLDEEAREVVDHE
jgi:atypical dual specificity phosphatase